MKQQAPENAAEAMADVMADVMQDMIQKPKPTPITGEAFFVRVWDGQDWQDCEDYEGVEHVAVNLVKGYWEPVYLDRYGYGIICEGRTIMSDGTVRSRDVREDLCQYARDYCNDQHLPYPGWADEYGTYERDRREEDDCPSRKHPDAP